MTEEQWERFKEREAERLRVPLCEPVYVSAEAFPRWENWTKKENENSIAEFHASERQGSP